MDSTSKPLVTVAIPVHNRADLLPQSLESVVGQTWTHWECIVIDDHSTDDSLRVAEALAAQDDRIRVYSLPDPRRGPAAGRHYGLALARGEFISYLDSDDLFAPHKLEAQLEMFQQSPQLDFVNCRYAIFDRSLDNVLQPPYPPQSHHLEYLLLGAEDISPWQSGCPLWRTGRLREIGGWDESLPHIEDLELFLRAEANGLMSSRVEESLYFLRRSDQERHSGDSRLTKEDQRRRVYLMSWLSLEGAGLATDLRRRLCGENFYRRALVLGRSGKRVKALRDYVSDSQVIGLSWPHTLLGAGLLFSRYHRILTPLAARLKQPYYAHRQALPPPLPGLTTKPVTSQMLVQTISAGSP